MQLLEATLRACESETTADALRAVVDVLRGDPPVLRAALWLDAEGVVRASWPDGASPGAAVAVAAAAGGDGARTVETEDGTAALLLPLGDATGTLVLLGAGGASDADAPWERLARAFGRLAAAELRARELEAERDALRQRAEESEGLHVLGLAANRTLDPDEVLEVVARFTRNLLGAHYVTVSTEEEGRIRTLASVGLHASGTAGDDPFAARVVAARKPLTLPGDGGGGGIPDFHAREGMRTGIGVPLSLFGETFGALVVGYRRDYLPGPRDLRLALTLAGHAAVAISNARLHRALADRSRELERAYAELRWTAEAKERFFASMSHELRTPLNAILGYHSLLLDGVAGRLPDELRPFLEKADRATRNLLHLVNDVLDLSKIEAGKMELVHRPVRPHEVVEEAVANVEPLAARKGLALQLSVPRTLPTASTDGDRVRQILVNLLSNAVKFTDEGRVAVTAAAVEGPAGASWLEVRVEDTGPGIAAEDQERIFHEFEQIVGATSHSGTGLGLPISRKLARLLGGDLRVESTPGLGAAFILRVPLQRDAGSGTAVA